MAINATIDGQIYNNILSIVAGGKVVDLTAPGGAYDVKSGPCSFASGFNIAHGCGKRPKYVFIYLDDYSSATPTLNKTCFAFYINGIGSSCVISNNGTIMWNSCYMQNMGALADDTTVERNGLTVDATHIRFVPALSGYDAPATWYAFYEV